MTETAPQYGSQPAPPTIDEQIDCVRREIGMRQRVYPKWIESRRLTQETADRELTRMRAVLATLERVKAQQ